MRKIDTDLLVIGAGSGGLSVAAGGTTRLRDRERGHGHEASTRTQEHRSRRRTRHAPHHRKAAERETDEEAVHDPTLVDDQVLDRPGQQHDSGERGHGHGAEQHQRRHAEPQRAHLGHRGDEAGIDPRGQQHGATRDPGDQVGQSHEHPAERGADQDERTQDGFERRRGHRTPGIRERAQREPRVCARPGTAASTGIRT